jgi:hypothetical protein
LEAYYAFVKKVVVAFDGAELDYAFTGALAISFYGIPRTTSDIDVIIAVANKADVKIKLMAALCKAGLLVDVREIDNALTSGFSILSFKDSISPYSLDVILSTEKLDKRSGKVAGLETFLQSPEGLIAAKLRMIKVTLPPERSVKDKKDIEAVLKFTKVDLKIVESQAKKDKTKDVFDSLGLNT